MSNPDGVARRIRIPNDDLAVAWSSIKLPDGVRERLLAQSLLSFTIRQQLPFEVGAAARPYIAERRARYGQDDDSTRARQPSSASAPKDEMHVC